MLMGGKKDLFTLSSEDQHMSMYVTGSYIPLGWSPNYKYSSKA
jgi:hypothetical protein